MTRISDGRIALVLVMLVCLLASVFPVARGDEVPDRDEAVAAGHKAFESRGNVPWYDSDKDALRPVRLPSPPAYRLDWLFKPLFWLIVALAGVSLALLVWWTVWAFVRRQRRAPQPVPVGEPSIETEGLEALPFLEDRPRDDLLGRARRHYEAGNYAEAIIYLFSYELVELDQSSVVRLTRGKTNRQYLREASRTAGLAALLERTMDAFEGVFFGGHSLDRPSFEVCWSALDEFQRLIAAARGAS